MLVEFPCKTGKIQVSEQGLLQIMQFKKVLWQTACGDITGLTTQPGPMLTVNVTIQTTRDTYLAEMVTSANFKKLEALFPHLQTHAVGKEWYHNPTARTYVGVYTNEKQMQREVQAAGQHGWIPQTSAATASHINVGRTAVKVALLGPISLITGASRSKEKMTLTFVRSQEWLAQHP